MADTVRIDCSKVGCVREAVELLLLREDLPREFGRKDWEVKPRCDIHPAIEDVRMARMVEPGTQVAIVPLPSRIEVPGA